MRLERSGCQNPRRRSPDGHHKKPHLSVRSRSLSPVRTSPNPAGGASYRYDSHNRLHVNYPKTGRIHVYNRAMKFHSSTVETHANDLTKILLYDINAEKKTAVSITCDNGPDWNFKSPLTHLYMGRLWRDTNLDYLVLVSFAPGHSAENMIEHAWAPLGKFLVGVTLPATLPGESIPVCRQTGMASEEKERKEAKVLDAAIDDLNSYWNKSFDGFPIDSKKVACQEPSSLKQYNDYNTVKSFFDAGVRKRNENAEFVQIWNEYQLLMQHCRKTTYRLEFIKCQSLYCPHCKHNPVQAKSLFSLLQKFDGGMCSPTASNSVPGSYSTFLELAFSPLCRHVNSLDEECPSIKEKGRKEIVQCNECCRYIYSSNADAKRHQSIVHRVKSMQKRKVSKKTQSAKKLKPGI